nr:SGNH hydrolase-type esterase domain-containing protein [Tanacetum cinerariifolium]
MQLKEEDDLEQRMAHGSVDGLKYDPSNVKFTEWLASKFYNHGTMDWYTKNALWIYWARGDDEVKLIDEETSDSDDNDEMSLLKILGDSRLMTNIRMIGFTNGTKMCHGYRKSHGWMLEHEKNPHMLNIIASLFNYKSGCSKWPTCSWREIGYCNGGNLPGAYIVGNSLHYQDLEWYEALKDGELKEEALKNKAVMEGIIEEDYESSNEGWRRWDGYEITNRDHEEREFKMEHNNEGRCELFDDHELLVCNIRKFKMSSVHSGMMKSTLL